MNYIHVNSNPRVLVIGGYGYIGSYVCAQFEKVKIDYEICDTRERGKPNQARDALFRNDFCSLTLEDLNPFDLIFNFGGTSSVAAALKDPMKTLRNNVLGHQHLLSLTKMGEKKYIYASSGSVYDGSQAVTAMESDPLAPSRNIYDFSKVTADELSRISGGRWTALRFGTVIGGSYNMRYELVLNRMVLDALQKKEIMVSNENANRALLSIRDLARVMIEIVRGREINGIFNLASFNATMLQLAEGVSAITGARIQFLKPTSTYDFSMSNEKIRIVLPEVSFENLNDVIKSLILFYDEGRIRGIEE